MKVTGFSREASKNFEKKSTNRPPFFQRGRRKMYKVKIIDFFKGEAMSGGGDACERAVSPLKDARDGMGIDFSSSHIDESAYDITRHFIKKPIAFDANQETILC